MSYYLKLSKSDICRVLRAFPDRKEKGFALIVTLSLMLLLALVVLGMLSTATVFQRTVIQGSAETEAKSNARLALVMALGELQKHTGPDQRVTAEAEILSESGFAGWDASVDKNHYVGVYSTEKWHERDVDQIRHSLKSYENSRNEKAFQRWLVSGAAEEVESLDFARTALSSNELARVLGKGSVGDEALSYVEVPKETLTDAEGKTTGRLAWWVADQGVKAKVNLAKNELDVASAWDRRFALANPLQLGVDQILGWENFDVAKANQDQLKNLLTPRQIELFDDEAVSSEDLEARFHDVTTYSYGVLADVALGGLKRDLSLPFELPKLAPPVSSDWNYELNQSDELARRDRDFTSIWEFSNSGDQNANWSSIYWPSNYRPDWWANRLGYVFMLPDSNGGNDAAGFNRYLRGPTWQLLRNHYRSYKREYENQLSSTVERRGWSSPSDERTWLARSYEPSSDWHNAKGNHLLSTTYVGDRGGMDSLVSPDLFDPFYRFGFHNGRPWNNLGLESMGLAPVFTKVGLVLSHQTKPAEAGRTLEMVMNATGTIWNPYNVAIEFEAVFVNLDLKGLKWNFTKKRADGSKVEVAVDPEQRTFGREKYFPYQHFRLGVTAEQDPNYPFNSRRPSKLIRLNPGESRTFALSFGAPRPFLWANMTAAPGSFSNNWEGGMSLRFVNMWKVEQGDKFEFELIPQKDEKISVETFLGYFERSNGSFANPFAANSQGTGFQDLPELSSLHVTSAADILPGGGKLQKLLSHFSEEQEAICQIEFNLRSSGNSPHGVLGDFNPRAIVNHSRAMGASEKGSVPANWDVTAELVSDFDLVQAGIGPRNNGFWGNSNDGSGQTHVVAFEIPDAPITSIAAFQNLQTGANGWDASYAIGNSFLPPKVPQTELFEQKNTDSSYRSTFYDMSYLSNQGLWDRYYFSGLQLSENSSNPLSEAERVMTQFIDFQEPNPLHNKRLAPAPVPVGISKERRLQELTHYRWMARHLMIDGAANINSTRVEAWKAWLSSLNGAEVDQVDPNGQLSTSSGDGTPFVRSLVSGGGEGDHWRGYTRLSETEIGTLAENIVLEVKKRGPFLSVADFVNRRLSSDETGKMGALQAALMASGLDTGTSSEIGIPGTIRQGDLLNSLGSTISARSDSFVIRAYGESVSPNNPDKILARAWCEAVVQRVPELVGEQGELLTKPNPDYPGKNPAGQDDYIENDDLVAQKFGRQYRVISFRWLSADEV